MCSLFVVASYLIWFEQSSEISSFFAGLCFCFCSRRFVLSRLIAFCIAISCLLQFGSMFDTMKYQGRQLDLNMQPYLNRCLITLFLFFLRPLMNLIQLFICLWCLCSVCVRFVFVSFSIRWPMYWTHIIYSSLLKPVFCSSPVLFYFFLHEPHLFSLVIRKHKHKTCFQRNSSGTTPL